MRQTARSMDTTLHLFWIPLGAGASVVRSSGRLYERAVATLDRRRPCALYHSALVAHVDGAVTTIEMTPIPNPTGDPGGDRGVVAEGAVGDRRLGRWRIFRYEVRRWAGGVIPDLDSAVASPVVVTADDAVVRQVLTAVAAVPTPVWGRDENRWGEMWNCNSVIAWTLTQAGVIDRAGPPPPGGRAPGWQAGVQAARVRPIPPSTIAPAAT
jgi:hypothetical protein